MIVSFLSFPRLKKPSGADYPLRAMCIPSLYPVYFLISCRAHHLLNGQCPIVVIPPTQSRPFFFLRPFFLVPPNGLFEKGVLRRNLYPWLSPPLCYDRFRLFGPPLNYRLLTMVAGVPLLPFIFFDLLRAAAMASSCADVAFLFCFFGCPSGIFSRLIEATGLKMVVAASESRRAPMF